MTVLLRTADGLECFTHIDRFQAEVRRPVLEVTDTHQKTVVAMRTYVYVGTDSTDTAIYEERF